MIDVIITIAKIALSLTFVVAAVFKIRSWVSASGANSDGNPEAPASHTLLGGVAVIEFAVAIALLVPQTATLAASVALILLFAFSWYIWWIVRRTGQAACGCFGSYTWGGGVRVAFLRNALLAALAAVSLIEPLALQTGPAIEVLGRLLAVWTIPMVILCLAIVPQKPQPTRSEPPKQITTMDTLRKRLAAVTLPSEKSGIIRLSDLEGESLFLLCIHSGCEECEALMALSRLWNSGTGQTAVLVAPRGVRMEGNADEVVVAIDQTFEVGRLCGAQQPPVACLMQGEDHSVSYVTQGHDEVSALLRGMKSTTTELLHV